MITAEKLNQRVTDFSRRCKELKQKLTPQRVEVFRVLAGTEEHPDVDTIYRLVSETLPNISLDTVYRVLDRLEDLNLVMKVETPGSRARYDANTGSHPHFVCNNCGCVIDIPLDTTPEPKLPPSMKGIARVDSVHLHYRGICSVCEKNGMPLQ